MQDDRQARAGDLVSWVQQPYFLKMEYSDSGELGTQAVLFRFETLRFRHTQLRLGTRKDYQEKDLQTHPDFGGLFLIKVQT